MKKIEQQTKNFIGELLGEPTMAKASGTLFTFTTIVPVLIALVFSVLLGTLGLLTEETAEQTWYLYANMLLVQLSFVIVAFVYFYWTKQPIRQTIAIEKCPWKYFLLALVLQFGLFSLSSLNSLFLQWLGVEGDMGGTEQMMQSSSLLPLLLTIALLPALMEEVIFRGLLLRGLRAFGLVGSVLLCGGLFSIYHQNPAQTIYQFCCGAAFALLTVRSGSIVPTMLSHFLNNAVIIFLYKFNIISLPLAVLIVSGVCLICSLAYLIFIDKRVAYATDTNKQTIKEQSLERKNFWIFSAIGVILCLISWATALFKGM